MDRDNIGSYGDARWAKARYSGTLDYNPDRGSPMVKPAQTGEFRPLPDVNENEREKAIRRVAECGSSHERSDYSRGRPGSFSRIGSGLALP
jgi:hypothetical protein